jgi:DNA-binding response OmpR family regulator
MEDDVVLSDILLDYLKESWDVDYAYDSEEVYAHLEKKQYDMFIFDINVNGKSGLKLLQELREFNNTTPTIIITAYTDTNYLKQAFEYGANDYIKKPFELEELNARIKNTQKIFHLNDDENISISNSITFNPSSKQLIKDSKIINISSKDAKILHYLIKNPSRVVTNEELTQNIWDYDSIPSDATIRSHIRTLRDLIGKDTIQTIRGEGYKYE